MGRWLTIKDKRALIAKAGENPGMTHTELAEWSTKTYNLGRPLARSTVSDILRKAPQTMSPAHEDTSILFPGVSEAAVTRKKSSESCDVDIHEVVANTSAMRI
ncbi:hypothetical protein F443_07547 [Phytophthora nicotianae P1569]|uniref:Uncharacterized protein n=1 Tax=Phytophthora nicotianae P1569 TaxID=1317065 RepID=V9FBE6_PHYNI|nr:hypothetical protein F443_07547 [Phytophthora nicotianae P1569]